MTHKQITAALLQLTPKAQWSLRGADLKDLKWNDTVIPRPTDETIIAAISSN